MCLRMPRVKFLCKHCKEKQILEIPVLGFGGALLGHFIGKTLTRSK